MSAPPEEPRGRLIETDILVIGAGAGGLFGALSAKRHAPPGTRVTLVDTWMVGRTGHTAFSSAGMVALLPSDDLDAITAEIITGNEWIADQRLVHDVLGMSYDRIRDIEAMGMQFPKGASGEYVRRPTRGLDATRKTFPFGGGLELCWKLRLTLEREGVEVIDRLFVTGLLRGGERRVIGAVGMHGRSGEFHAFKARVTILATNSVSFRPGFVRDITGTGTLLAYEAGAALRNAEFSYARPGTPNFYFEGITNAIQDGARWINVHGRRFMPDYEPVWGDEADVPRITRAMALERRQGNAPLYLDMAGVPAAQRAYYTKSKVSWMALFYEKLGSEARTDMFDKTPYYPMNQMSKMGIRTDHTCRSDVPGLLAAGLAQAGCANHFAGFHIPMAIGTGWIAGRSAAEDLSALPAPRLDPTEVRAQYAALAAARDEDAIAQSDRILRNLQEVMLSCDVMLWKHEERLRPALARIRALRAEAAAASAPHVHELVRLKETDAMLLAAELILEASLMRTESRLAHLREDFDFRDDGDWLCWIDIVSEGNRPRLDRTPIPTPLHPLRSNTQAVARVVEGAH